MAFIVADSSPLIALARIGRLELLRRLASDVVVPPAVWREMTGDLTKPGAGDISRTAWLRVVTPRPESVRLLAGEADEGETEAVALARDIPDSVLLMDETEGRKLARRLKVPLVGTIGLLVKAKQAGLLTALKPECQALKANGIYLDDDLIEQTLKSVGE